MKIYQTKITVQHSHFISLAEQNEIEYWSEACGVNRHKPHLNFNKNLWCTLLGHKWNYKNYVDRVNQKGKKYHFTDKRFCHRCDAVQYKYDKWENRLRDIDWELPVP
jgi:hypothetical protein